MDAGVVIIGGGLAGLCAAHRLVHDDPPVTLVEAHHRLGGQLHTVTTTDALVELGAEGFVARSVAVPQVCAEVGIDDELIGQASTVTLADTDDGLVPLQPGEAARILGFQVPAEELGRGIRSLRRGMGSLADALAASLTARGVDLRLGVPVDTLQRADGGLRVHLADGTRLDAAAAVLATPAVVAGGVSAALAPRTAAAVAGAPTLSNLSVSLLYARDHVEHPLDASGAILRADTRHEGVRACTFVSSKFAGRAREGVVQFRVFFRPTDAELADRPDGHWAARAHDVVQDLVGATAAPSATWVSRWAHALPVHTDAHRRAVTELESELHPFDVVLAGSAFHGAGIDAAVRSGLAAASHLLAQRRAR